MRRIPSRLQCSPDRERSPELYLAYEHIVVMTRHKFHLSLYRGLVTLLAVLPVK